MRALDIITKKRNGGVHDAAEIDFLIAGYLGGTIPDYQMSAWLMAVCFQGMTTNETTILTNSMIHSGATYNLSTIKNPKVDKHSTGGVGDKTSIILAPLIAAAGCTVPMMSGRSLGHTGGTLDKLESIPGYSTQLSQTDFARTLSGCGFAMIGQTADLVPADRLLYALRDVTGTIESIPLITASILSKKFAAGVQAIVFDVKTGNGAFMKSPEMARRLAQSLVGASQSLGLNSVAVISTMDFPLGTATGNFLEIEECWTCMQPNSTSWKAELVDDKLQVSGPSAELMHLTLNLAAQMLILAKKARTLEEGFAISLRLLSDGSVFDLFKKNIVLQGGDVEAVTRMIGTFRAPHTKDILAHEDGWFTGLDAYEAGMAGLDLGIGRSVATDAVYPDVGFLIRSPRNTKVHQGQVLCTLYARSQDSLETACARIASAISIEAKPQSEVSLIREVVNTP